MDLQDVSPQLQKLASEFQYKDPPDFLIRLQELISYLLRALADFLKQFKIMIPGMTDTSAVGDVMQIVIIAIGAICLTAILVMMSSRMKQLNEQAQLARRGALSLEEILDSAGWKQKAEEFAKEKLFKDACRALYLSIIYLLDEKKILAYAPTRSNYEYWYALSGKEQMQKGFRRLADVVEEIWFGNHHALEEDYEECLKQSGGLEEDINYWAQKLEAGV